LAARILHDESLVDDAARIRQAYRLVLNRLPSDGELKIAEQFIARANANYEETTIAQSDSPTESSPTVTSSSEAPTAADTEDAAATETATKEKQDKKDDESPAKKEPPKPEPPPKKLNGWEQFAHVLLSSNEFAFVD